MDMVYLYCIAVYAYIYPYPFHILHYIQVYSNQDDNNDDRRWWWWFSPYFENAMTSTKQRAVCSFGVSFLLFLNFHHINIVFFVFPFITILLLCWFLSENGFLRFRVDIWLEDGWIGCKGFMLNIEMKDEMDVRKMKLYFSNFPHCACWLNEMLSYYYFYFHLFRSSSLFFIFRLFQKSDNLKIKKRRKIHLIDKCLE